MITVTGPLTGQSAVAESILRALPEWFGVEEATLDYITQANVLPTFVAYGSLDSDPKLDSDPALDSDPKLDSDPALDSDPKLDSDPASGFLTLRQHSPDAAEILVMGVLPTVQRQGVGQALVAAAEAYLRGTQTRFLQVKTLSPRNPDPGYAATRRFYEALGFCRLEEFPDLWDADNPCLQLIKYLHPEP
jgi:ribosomal protein S18 acetylase RimI-like enzyme